MSGGLGNNCGVVGSNYDCQNGTGGTLQVASRCSSGGFVGYNVSSTTGSAGADGTSSASGADLETTASSGNYSSGGSGSADSNGGTGTTGYIQIYKLLPSKY